MIILLILNLNFIWFEVLEYIFIYLSLLLTVISLVDYLVKNKSVISDGGMSK